MPLQARPMHLPEPIYRKIEADAAPEHIRNSLLDACAAVQDPSAVEGAIEKFCRGKQLCGPDVTLGPRERLGHVKPEKRTVSDTAKELAMDPAEVGQYIEGLAGEGTRIEIDLAEKWFENEIVKGSGRHIKIARRPAWLFRTNDRVSDPFNGDVSCLPWCLALPRWADKHRPPPEIPCLGYLVPAGSIQAKTPTVIDAGYDAVSVYWHPGGKTVSHAHGPVSCVGGFDEVVVEPPPLGTIERRIVRFKSKSI